MVRPDQPDPLDSPDPLYVAASRHLQVLTLKIWVSFLTSFCNFCRDRVLMDRLVPRERLERMALRETPDLPDLLDLLVPLDLRFVRARATAVTARCASLLPSAQQGSLSFLGTRRKQRTQGIPRT